MSEYGGFEARVLSELATIQTILSKLPCDKHETNISKQDKMLRGENGDGEGLCEKVRGLQKRNAMVAGFVSVAVFAAYQLVLKLF